MIIFPAIDIQNGQCVRLRQGVESDATVYGRDPVKMAKKWEAEGAQYLHVVDLDGAFQGDGINTGIIRRICQAVSIPVEVGGGIRTKEAIRTHLENGAARVIIGSRAAEDPSFAAESADEWGGRVAVSVDAKGDIVTTHGWVDGSGEKVLPFVKKLLENGIETIIYTDISRDGMLSGPNLFMLERLNQLSGISLVASGGIASPDDLRQLDAMDMYGAICGKALYEGYITMADIREIQE